MMDRYPEAVNDCDQAVRIDPTMIKLVSRKGRALLRIGELDAALAAFQKVLAFVPMTKENKEEDAALKTEARSYQQTVMTAKENMKELMRHESQRAHDRALTLAEDLIQSCPNSHVVHVAKANALVQLSRWTEAKDFIEAILDNTSSSLLGDHAHAMAAFPVPSREKLLWLDSGANNMVQISEDAIVNAILCMGSELGALYITCLKNLDINRTCCKDVMDRIASITVKLANVIGNTATLLRWKWVSEERSRVQLLINTKNKGDKMFKLGRFHEALHHYSEALDVHFSVSFTFN
jgi:tetratricopeptide (TPR) repeat protein